MICDPAAFPLWHVVNETDACRHRVAGGGSKGAHRALMKDEEPCAQMQGCGARAWAEWSWDSNQLPAG